MIYGTLLDSPHYPLGPIWNELASVLVREGQNLADGRYTIDGCAVNVSTRETHLPPEGRYESHPRACEVQMIIEGAEWHYVAPVECLVPEDPSSDSDTLFYRDPDASVDVLRLHLVPGFLVLHFPWDGHRPRMAVDNIRNTVRKLVVSIPLETMITCGQAFFPIQAGR